MRITSLRFYRFLAALTLLLSTAPCAADPRQVYGNGAPAWLRAVGKLQVPGLRYRQGHGEHRRESCSATLIAGGNSNRADTLVTAWHCLEDYRDLSQPITFTLRPGRDTAISRQAYRVADGGGMHADWAVLKLLRPIDLPFAATLKIHPNRADRVRPITMAGYSTDPGLGAGGDTLTYHTDCRITRQSREQSESDCLAFKGASGGAVVQRNEGGEALLCGIISRGDGATLSTYVPVQQFRGTLNRFLD